MANMSVENITLDCPVYTNSSEKLIEQVQFWVGGVTQTCLAVPGFIGNVIFCFILTRKELRNAFNLLLVALACFDSCYIIGALLESLRTSFKMATDVHIMLFPYLLYPGQSIALTGSIFMIVAIAFERYIAVHNPLDYNQAMNDAGAIKRRLCKYLLPVLLASILFNMPKFFEATFVRATRTTSSGVNVTRVLLNVTEMRMSPAYSTYANWSQSLVLGFLPTVLLAYFNTKIYLDVRERERRKRPAKFQKPLPMNEGNPVINAPHPKNGNDSVKKLGPASTAVVAAGDDVSVLVVPAEEEDSNDLEDGRLVVPEVARLRCPSSQQLTASTSCLTISRTPSTVAHGSSGVTPAAPGTPATAHNNCNAKRRKAEDKMAMIFVAIVTGFLVTNLPRILLDLHEILVFENAVACTKARLISFPVWSRVLNSFSHLLLVINSSMNIIFYGVFNQQFRLTAKKHFVENVNLCRKTGLFKGRRSNGQGFSFNNSRSAANGRINLDKKTANETAV